MCHGGVVLRAVLFVHLALALGLMFGASGFEAWLTQLALATGVALPGVLLWLVFSCVLKDRLAPLPVPAQWVPPHLRSVRFAQEVHGRCRRLSAWARWPKGRAYAPGRWRRSDARRRGVSAALFYWLRLRAIAQGPADSSARLAELQSRIRPHFLFNTLNTAIALARIDPADRRAARGSGRAVSCRACRHRRRRHAWR